MKSEENKCPRCNKVVSGVDALVEKYGNIAKEDQILTICVLCGEYVLVDKQTHQLSVCNWDETDVALYVGLDKYASFKSYKDSINLESKLLKELVKLYKL